MITLISSFDKTIGMGHYRRCSNIQLFLEREFLNVKCITLMLNESLRDALQSVQDLNIPSIIIFDLHASHISLDINKLLSDLRLKKHKLIGLDCLIEFSNHLDFLWLPTLYLDDETKHSIKCNYCYGLESILFPRNVLEDWDSSISKDNSLTVCTGASDTTNLGSWMPNQLAQLKSNAIDQINWIQGPYASDPIIDHAMISNIELRVIKSPSNIFNYFRKSKFVLSVYGISVFESLACKSLTHVFSPYGLKDNDNLRRLGELNLASISFDIQGVLNDLENFFLDTKKQNLIMDQLQQLDCYVGLSKFQSMIQSL